MQAIPQKVKQKANRAVWVQRRHLRRGGGCHLRCNEPGISLGLSSCCARAVFQQAAAARVGRRQRGAGKLPLLPPLTVTTWLRITARPD